MTPQDRWVYLGEGNELMYAKQWTTAQFARDSAAIPTISVSNATGTTSAQALVLHELTLDAGIY